MGDGIYGNRFRMWGYNPLDKVERKDLSLPVDIDCEPAIQIEKNDVTKWII